MEGEIVKVGRGLCSGLGDVGIELVMLWLRATTS